MSRRNLLPHFLHKLVAKESPESSPPRPPALSIVSRPKVFGRDLSEQLFESPCHVPPVVSACCDFIERFGALDGIYRLSGVNSNIERLRALFESGQHVDLAADPRVLADIHCVASLLKLFFRALPNPLLTFEAFDAFVAVIRDDTSTTEQRQTSLRTLCRRLPPPHFRTLRALCTHLKHVSLESARTGMTAKNLSIVWAPNLLRARDLETSFDCFEIIGVQTRVTQFLIEFAHEVFADGRPPRLNSRKLSDVKSEPKPLSVRCLSQDSFFGPSASRLRLDFAKTQTRIEVIPTVVRFDFRAPLVAALVVTCPPLEISRTTTTTTAQSVVVSVVGVVDDAVVVRHNSRERIKEKRRQQLRQQFARDDAKPVPSPRRSSLRPPVPTPRKSRDSPEIRILVTKKSKTKNL